MLAKEIQAARKAGLVMTVVDGEIQWMGTGRQWKEYETKLGLRLERLRERRLSFIGHV